MKRKVKVAVIMGTRPDIIKMAPVITKLKRHPRFKVFVISTAQHRQMSDQMLGVLPVNVDLDLDTMTGNQKLAAVSSRLVKQLALTIGKLKPNIVLVQGDTTTAFIGSLAAFYNKVSIGHIEAGLRTYDKYQPFPEEINRKLISSLADLHLAPTEKARNNLLREGASPRNIYVTGNTVIDALLMMVSHRRKIHEGLDNRLLKKIPKNHKIILVTAHRRENWGRPLRNICKALKKLVTLHPDISVIYPVHPNPNIKKPVFDMLNKIPGIFLISPLDYEQFVGYLQRCYLVLTDSGGIQEEAPSLGKPVLVMREVTERPEAIKAGTIKLVGTDTGKILSEVDRLLRDKKAYQRMASAINPYGDGKAAERIAEALLYYFKFRKTGPSEFKPKLRIK